MKPRHPAHLLAKAFRQIAKPKRNLPTATRSEQPSISDLQSQVSALGRELAEARAEQTASSEVLRVISSSPGELQPVFQAILENAIRICEAKFGCIFRYDGDVFHLAAAINMPPELAKFQNKRGPFKAEPGSGLNRVLQTK